MVSNSRNQKLNGGLKTKKRRNIVRKELERKERLKNERFFPLKCLKKKKTLTNIHNIPFQYEHRLDPSVYHHGHQNEIMVQIYHVLLSQLNHKM